VSSRTDLAAHKRPYAHDHVPLADLLSAIEALRPTALIGVSGQARSFSRASVEAMARLNARPIVFALSNPTSQSECSAEEAYSWSAGRAIFASGSPFDPVTLNGNTYVPGQGNNAYIFPGVGLGVVATRARHVSDEMFMAAGKTLARELRAEDLAQGRIYPPLSRIRSVSAAIATAVAEVAYQQGLAAEPAPHDLRAYVESLMYQPVYKAYG
jgi:malate dehydrogenase (oxaloacetate-decarboxylating)(NADP+)